MRARARKRPCMVVSNRERGGNARSCGRADTREPRVNGDVVNRSTGREKEAEPLCLFFVASGCAGGPCEDMSDDDANQTTTDNYTNDSYVDHNLPTAFEEANPCKSHHHYTDHNANHTNTQHNIVTVSPPARRRPLTTDHSTETYTNLKHRHGFPACPPSPTHHRQEHL